MKNLTNIEEKKQRLKEFVSKELKELSDYPKIPVEIETDIIVRKAILILLQKQEYIMLSTAIWEVLVSFSGNEISLNEAHDEILREIAWELTMPLLSGEITTNEAHKYLEQNISDDYTRFELSQADLQRLADYANEYIYPSADDTYKLSVNGVEKLLKEYSRIKRNANKL